VPGFRHAGPVETFVALEAFIDNWRWAGVPFRLVTGKRLASRATEVVVSFRPVSHWLFARPDAGRAPPNRLRMRLQPEEQVELGLIGSLSAPEWESLRAMHARSAANYGIQSRRDVVNDIAPSVATFQPGGDVLPGMVRAVEVKGHTPGHSAFRIGTGANSLLYVGDSMHHHVVSLQKPDWHIAFDGDAKTGAASRAALLEELAAGNQRIYAVHFPFPGLGRIQKGDAGFTWVPEQ